MHKTPIGSRLIIGSKTSSLKPLGKDITKKFKVIFNYKRRYYKKQCVCSGIKNFWCVDKNSVVTEMLDRINAKRMLALFLHLILLPYTLKFPTTNIVKYYVRWLILFFILLSENVLPSVRRAYWVKKGEVKIQLTMLTRLKMVLYF